MTYYAHKKGARLKLLAFLVTIFAMTAVHAENSSPWTDRISAQGDLRVRHEWISRSGTTDTSDTQRERYRARIGLNGKVNDSITAKFRLASSDGANPVSTTSTFTDNSS